MLSHSKVDGLDIVSDVYSGRHAKDLAVIDVVVSIDELG